MDGNVSSVQQLQSGFLYVGGATGHIGLLVFGT